MIGKAFALSTKSLRLVSNPRVWISPEDVPDLRRRVLQTEYGRRVAQLILLNARKQAAARGLELSELAAFDKQPAKGCFALTSNAVRCGAFWLWMPWSAKTNR